MEKARVLPRSGQILPQALPLRAAVKLPLLHWRRRAYRSFPSRSPASGDFPRVLYLLCFNYFFFFEAFLAFLFFAITGLHQRLKEAKHEARPYCDGLFDFRNEPRRTESFRLSTSGASGLEEKFVFNMLQVCEKYFRRITHNKKSSKSYLIVEQRTAPRCGHFCSHVSEKIARNDRILSRWGR